MKTVLIIASFWPYRQGSRRNAMIRYLPEFGWNPIILTPKLESKPAASFQVEETPFTSVLGPFGKILHLDSDSKASNQFKEPLKTKASSRLLAPLLTCGGAVLNYPDAYKNWRTYALEAGKRIMSRQPVDAILSIWPITSHLIARELAAKFKVRWIADYPDLWSQNAFYTYGSLRRWLDKKIELKTMAGVNALTTISDPMAQELRTLHKTKPVYAIPHGFDPDEVNVPPVGLTHKFTITYTGRLYPEKRDTSKLFIALKELISSGSIDPADIEVRFFGPILEWLDNESEKNGLSGVFKQYGIVPIRTSLEKQRESQVLLLLDWEDTKQKGVYTGKIFEYLGSRRPILATGGTPDNVIDKLLKDTKAGIHATTTEEIQKAIKQLYDEYRTKGEVAYLADESAVNKYNLREIARKFTEIFDSLTNTTTR